MKIFILLILSLCAINVRSSRRIIEYSAIEREGQPENPDGKQPEEYQPPYKEGDENTESSSTNTQEEDEVNFKDNVQLFTPIERRLTDLFKPYLITPFFSDGNPLSHNRGRWFWDIRKPWWMGENVCTDNKVVEDAQKNPDKDVSSMIIPIHIQSKRCIEEDESYVCTTKLITKTENRTTITLYRCCFGYILNPLKTACIKDNLKNVTETLNIVGATKMASLLNDNQFERILDTNITIFTPTDESLVDYEDITNKKMNEIPVISYPVAHDDFLFEMPSNHITPGLNKLEQLTNNQKLPTIHNRSTIRINAFYNDNFPVVRTANCIPIISSNIRAKNAVIHVVAGVLPHPTQSLYEILNDDPRFSTFMHLLQQNKMLDILSNLENDTTVIAPTNDAFNKLNPEILEVLKKGEGCVSRMLGAHLIRSYICKSAITKSYWHRSMASDRVIFTNEDKKMFVNGILVIENEKMAKNGIIYVINNVIIPESAKTFSKALSGLQSASDYYDFVVASGMLSELDKMMNVTFLLPVNPFNGTSEEPREFINRHIINKVNSPSLFYNNKLVKTINNKEIRFNTLDILPAISGLFSKSFAQCSLIMHKAIEMCGGIAYAISKPLAPSESFISEVVSSQPQLSIFEELLSNSSLHEKLSKESGPFTVLAPTDEAIKNNLDEEKLNMLKENPEERERFIQRHILPQTLCCSMMHYSGANRAIDGVIILTHLDMNDNIKLVSQSSMMAAPIKDCDLMAKNGVLHTISRPLYGGKPNIRKLPFFATFHF